MITQCCVCRKVHTPEGWREPTPAVMAGMAGPVSHGYCPECLSKALADIESLVKPTTTKSEVVGSLVPFIATIPSPAR